MEKDCVPTILPEQEIPDVTQTQPQMLSRRGFLRNATLGAGAVAVAGTVLSPKTAEGYSEEQEYKDLVTEIDTLWGFKIENTYGTVSIDEIKSIRKSLEVFPLGFAHMLSYTRSPLITEAQQYFYHRIEDGITIRFGDIAEKNADESLMGQADHTRGEIRIDPKYDKQTSSIFYHEVGHFLHGAVGDCMISASGQHVGNEYRKLSPEEAQDKGFIRRYGAKNNWEDFATYTEWIFTKGRFRELWESEYPNLTPRSKVKNRISKRSLCNCYQRINGQTIL